MTPKQEAFCLAYIECGNASEAYRRAYDAAAMADTTVHRKAKELLDNGKITARLAELRAPAVDAAQITLEQHLKDLKDLRDAALSEGKYSAAVSAEVARGKAAGLYVE
ncbi:MAG TPA: terminase small subunit, partial [Pseudoxanthomonas sp.]|nr:terminase small subunit [Pseudoxanthomonas sp.]